MHSKPLKGPAAARICNAALIAILFGGAAPVAAAGVTLAAPDSNSRITVENAAISDQETKLLFFTHPDLGDPRSGKRCPLNFYTVTLKPGLPAAPVDMAASEVCGSGLVRGELLDNGDVLVIAQDRLEHWRSGKRISTRSFRELPATRTLGVDSTAGLQMYAIRPSGSMVLAIPRGGSNQAGFPDTPLVVVGLDRDGELRWRYPFEASGQRVELKGLWASDTAGALLHVAKMTEDAASLAMPESLYFIDNQGRGKAVSQLTIDDQPSMEDLAKAGQQDMQKMFAMIRQSKSESLEKLAARARPDGGFSVLIQRRGGMEGREGHFLLQIGAGGVLESETPLSAIIGANGLQDWVDFTLSGNELVLLSRVSARHPEVRARRQTYPQNVISWIDVRTGDQISRLVPLDERYLQAAMNAGDEDFQHLDNLPGGRPVLLASLGEKPLAVSIGRLSRKTALRFDEGTDDLVAYTEALDQSRATAAREQQRQQRRQQQEALQQEMNAQMAASAGMTPEQFAAMSGRERKEALIRSGDVNTLTAMAAQQAQQAQAAAGLSSGQAMDAQVAAAMAQAQQAASQGTGNPELDAQMQAALAQVQQAMQGAGYAMPAASSDAAAAAPQKTRDDTVLEVNADLQGYAEFENLDGRPTTLLVYDRKTGQKLLSKTFEDGVVYEYIDFGDFDRPLDQVGVRYLDTQGQVLKQLTVVASH
ncbi:MAG: hypothetical protein PVG42_10950 [Lysobacterales bacterium]|jgi:hypothetical protein